jgi:hypothetical protein
MVVVRRIRTKTNNAFSDLLVDGFAKSESLSGDVLRFNSVVQTLCAGMSHQTQRTVATVLPLPPFAWFYISMT